MLFIFDMGGVVTTTFNMSQIYSKLNITKQDFFAICRYSGDDIWGLLQNGKISINKFWEVFTTRIGMLQRADFEGIMVSRESFGFSREFSVHNIPEIKYDLFRLYFHPQLNEQTKALILALRKKHRVVCGTNTIQPHWENHVERGDYSFFDQTYASNKIGVSKPDGEFFKVIMDAEGVTDPSQVFFTDDKTENVEAANKTGINGVLFENAERLTELWNQYL